MSEDLAIREQIAGLVEGTQSVTDFEGWLQEFAIDLEETLAQSLAADALRLLSEHENGDWTDDEITDQLGALSRFYWFEGAPKTVLSGSDAELINHDRRLAATGRSPVAECA